MIGIFNLSVTAVEFWRWEKLEKKFLYRQNTLRDSSSRPLTSEYRTLPAAPQLTVKIVSSDTDPINLRSEYFVFICEALQVSSVSCHLKIKYRKHLVFRFRLFTVLVYEPDSLHISNKEWRVWFRFGAHLIRSVLSTGGKENKYKPKGMCPKSRHDRYFFLLELKALRGMKFSRVCHINFTCSVEWGISSERLKKHFWTACYLGSVKWVLTLICQSSSFQCYIFFTSKSTYMIVRADRSDVHLRWRFPSLT